MKHRTHVPIILALAVLLAGSFPRVAFAEEDYGRSCAENYMACINDSGLLPPPYQEMADIECAAEYVGCVASKLRFW